MKTVQKILFPINFTENFEALLPWVATVAKKFDAKVYVLFVAEDLGHFSSFVPHGNIEAFQEETLVAARKRMESAAHEFSKALPKVETRVVAGKPGEKILELALAEKIDLIVMGSHGRKGLEHAIFGSVCEKVLRGAPCPVLCINPTKA